MPVAERIGIVGGGQLGRMLTEAAHPLGFQVIVLDPNENCPAAQVGAEQIVGALDDEEKIQGLAEKSDVTTWEIEHINTRALLATQAAGHEIQPSPQTLRAIQNKYEQKVLLHNAGLPVADFRQLRAGSNSQLELVRSRLGSKMIVKSKLGAYDGRGNLVYEGQSAEEIAETLGDNLYVEKLVDFKREVAVIAARDKAGKIALYPLVETVHEDNICHTVVAPAEVSPQTAEAAEEVARETLRHFDGAGVFAIEMFDTGDSVLINEIAPRVHNSGHLTIEANVTSQFEQHIRAVTGMPLGSTDLRVPAAAMINVLGTREESLSREGLEKVLALPDTHPRFYGKDPRPARKVGHITVLGASVEEIKKTAIKAREELAI